MNQQFYHGTDDQQVYPVVYDGTKENNAASLILYMTELNKTITIEVMEHSSLTL